MVERKGGGSVNKEVKWRPLRGGAEGGENLIAEVKRRPLYAGSHGGSHGGDGN